MSDQLPNTSKKPLATRHGLALLGFGLLVAVFLLFLLEGLLALVGLQPPDRYRDPFLGFDRGVDLFERARARGGSAIWRTREAKLAFFNQQSFLATKPANGFRVFALGGSTTYGRPYDWQMSFPRWLGVLLGDMDSQTSYEVINAGGISYASYRLVILMKELVGYQPDLFVIYTGHNEFLEQRSYPELKREGALSRRIKAKLNRLRTVTLLSRVLNPEASDRAGALMSREVKARLDVWSGLASYHRDDALQGAVLRHFELNIGRMIDLARENGVPILFVKPASNLKDFSPFKSEHGPAFDPSRQESFSALYASGPQLLRENRALEARDALERALAMDAEFADLHFRLGEARFRLGQNDRARFHFERARELDVCPLRCLNRMGEILQRITASRNVPLIDLPAMLAADSLAAQGHTLLGDEYFLDHVHPTTAVHQRIAEELLLKAMERGWLGFHQPLPPDREVRLYQPLVSAMDAVYFARKDLNLAKVLGWAGKVEEAARVLERSSQALVGDAELHFNSGVIFERLNRPREALRQYYETVLCEPNHFEAYFNAGKVLQKLEAPERALAAFKEACKLKPEHGEVHFNLGLCYRQLEEPEPALESFRRAADAHPPFPSAARYLALTYRDLGRWEDAIREARALVAADEKDAGAWFDLGVIYGRSGRLKRAAAAFQKTLELDPDDVEALRNLASAHQAAKRTDDALAVLRRVVELRPAEARAHFELGAVHHRLKQWDAAETAYREALRLEPSMARSLANLGAVYAANGKVEEGIETLRGALELEPAAGEVHYNLAQLYLLRREDRLASSHLRRARDLGVSIAPELLELLGRGPP